MAARLHLNAAPGQLVHDVVAALMPFRASLLVHGEQRVIIDMAKIAGGLGHNETGGLERLTPTSGIDKMRKMAGSSPNR